MDDEDVVEIIKEIDGQFEVVNRGMTNMKFGSDTQSDYATDHPEWLAYNLGITLGLLKRCQRMMQQWQSMPDCEDK